MSTSYRRPATTGTTWTETIVSILFEAWLVMLFAGVAHSLAHVIPAVGYGPSVIAVLALNWTTNRLRRIFK